MAPGKAPATDGQGRQARTSGHAGLTGAVAHQARRDSRPMISPRRRREEKGRRPPRRGSRGPARHNGDTLGKGCRVGCRLQGRRGAPGVTGAQWRTPWQPTTRRAAPAGARRVEAARGPKPPRPRRRTAPGRTPAAAGQGRQARNARSAGRTGVAAHQPRRAGRHETRLKRRRRTRPSVPRRDGRQPARDGGSMGRTGGRTGHRRHGKGLAVSEATQRRRQTTAQAPTRRTVQTGAAQALEA